MHPKPFYLNAAYDRMRLMYLPCDEKDAYEFGLRARKFLSEAGTPMFFQVADRSRAKSKLLRRQFVVSTDFFHIDEASVAIGDISYRGLVRPMLEFIAQDTVKQVVGRCIRALEIPEDRYRILTRNDIQRQLAGKWYNRQPQPF